MSTSAESVFNVISGNIYVAVFFSKSIVGKGDFLHVVKISFEKNRFFFILRHLFHTYKKLFLGQGWFFPVGTFKDKCFYEKLTSLASLNSFFYFPAKVPILAIFGYLDPFSQTIFSMWTENFMK